MVTDFVEHIDDAVDTLERVGDFSRRRHLPSSPLEKKCTGKTLQHDASRLRNNQLQRHSFLLSSVLS